jgi:hypothetical protein
MPDRRRLLDAVCTQCKRVIRRVELDGEPDDSVIQLKAECVADGLVPYDYFTDSEKPVTGHTNGCKNQGH